VSQFPVNSHFAADHPQSEDSGRREREEESVKQRSIRLTAVKESERLAAKEDAIHTLRRVEHRLRDKDLHSLADDLDAAIGEVIDL
jgi:hypothetical protein